MKNFIDHFSAIACNFEWEWTGGYISAMKDGRYYDPITALVKISKGEYLEGPAINKAYIDLGMPKKDYDFIMKVLYNPDYKDVNCRALRCQIERACGLEDEEAA